MSIHIKKDEISTLLIQGREISCLVKSRSNAKIVRYKIGPDCVLRITIPPRFPMRQLEELIQEKEDWIVKSYERVKTLAESIQAKVDVTDGGTVPFLGGELKVSIKKRETQRIRVEMEGSTLFITAGYNHIDDDITNVVILWYKAMAKREILVRTELWAGRIGVTFKKFFIKDQKTRWGSCSSQGNINFNYRLLMAPPDVIDYVVIHELCHLIHLNHSQAFWDIVAHYSPKYKKAKEWLKKEGPKLNFV